MLSVISLKMLIDLAYTLLFKSFNSSHDPTVSAKAIGSNSNTLYFPASTALQNSWFHHPSTKMAQIPFTLLSCSLLSSSLAIEVLLSVHHFSGLPLIGSASW